MLPQIDIIVLKVDTNITYCDFGAQNNWSSIHLILNREWLIYYARFSYISLLIKYSVINHNTEIITYL